jgi:hypothetical protein
MTLAELDERSLVFVDGNVFFTIRGGFVGMYGAAQAM